MPVGDFPCQVVAASIGHTNIKQQHVGTEVAYCGHHIVAAIHAANFVSFVPE